MRVYVTNKGAFLCLIICFLSFSLSWGQTVLKGTVIDSASHETVIGAIIKSDSTNAVSDVNGNYTLKLSKGTHTLTFSCLTYRDKKVTITAAGDTMTYNVSLGSEAQHMEAIVVSASMYEKNISEEDVSMSVMKGQTIENTGINVVDEAVNNIPGVTVIDNQANIRGGSGWAYGAGSRVLIMVDGMPELTPDASNTIWDFLPIEQVRQIEVIKGASSVLYGSSALNGVINMLTEWPGSKPTTDITFHEGVYLNPQLDTSDIWWRGKQQPRYDGFSFMHSQKINQFDLVVSGKLYSEQSFLQGQYDQRARIGFSTRYRFKNIPGLSIGVKSNYMIQNASTYLVWANDSNGIMAPLGGTSGPNTTNVYSLFKRANVDPFISYVAADGSKLLFQGRYFLSDNIDYGSNKGSVATSYYYELQYQRDFGHHFIATFGLSSIKDIVTAQLYGNHNSYTDAGYMQVDKKICNRLSLSGGLRYETYTIDDNSAKNSPLVYRFGANYRIATYTTVRASYGEGYRFPSIAEKFINSSVGPVNIYPNPDLQPETGYSAEVGVSQGMKIGNWMGYVDLALFYTKYTNLIDFSFGIWPPPGKPPYLLYLGFKSTNVEDARIPGTELTYTATGKIGKVQTVVDAGITYINPINVTQQDSVNKYESAHPNLTQSQKDSLAQTEILNYRSLVTAKLGFEATYKKFALGGNIRYNSFMANVDKIFIGEDPTIPNTEVIPGIKEFRQKHDKGDYIIDAHLAYQASDAVKVSFIIKNLLNRLYMVRPGLMGPPCTVNLQCTIRF